MSHNPGRIALFVPSLACGGAERVMVNLAQGFAQRGIKTDLVLGKAEGSYLAQVHKDVQIVDLKSSRILTSLPGLVRYLRENRPTAMFSALEHANFVAISARSLANVTTSIFVSMHSSLPAANTKFPLLSKRRLFPLFRRHLYPWADGIIAVSSGVAKSLSRISGIPVDSIDVIFNPVITDDLFSKASEPVDHPWFVKNEIPVIISVGRLSEEKDFPTLIRAYGQIRDRWPSKLLILGAGDLHSSLEKLVNDLGLENEVELPGFIENPYKYMAKSAVFVLSSKGEGLPTVLVEALAVGTPVISTDCPSGPREILMGGKLGTLVPVGDVGSLADAIAHALANKSREKISCSLNRFKVDAVVDQYLNLIQDKQSE